MGNFYSNGILPMAKAKRSRSRRKSLPPNQTVIIESLSQDGRGVTHIDGKAVFIDGALPGEEVEISFLSSRRKFDEARTEKVIKAVKSRVKPGCEWYELCGGCSFQHLAADKQIEYKQNSMLEALQHIGKVKPQKVIPPITASHWGYRRKARLGVKKVPAKGRVLVGFREKRNSYLADIHSCEILHPAVGHKLDELSDLVGSLSQPDRFPQIEVAIVENVKALVFRHMEPLTDEDKNKLEVFGNEHEFSIYLQSKGPETVIPLHKDQQELYYRHQDDDITIYLQPLDFFQVNYEINQQMLQQALASLDLQPDHRVLDLFCGLGNFTLPIAKRVNHVVGVEGSQAMVERARINAQRNAIENATFHAADLMSGVEKCSWTEGGYDRVLLDPPRSGAREILPAVAATGAKKIVYISCHPGTLARDTDILVNEFGYSLRSAGVMDMFPHTAHVESMAVFEK